MVEIRKKAKQQKYKQAEFTTKDGKNSEFEKEEIQIQRKTKKREVGNKVKN